VAEEVPKAKSRWKKRLLASVALLAIVTIGGKLGHDWYLFGRYIEKTDDAYVGGNITVVAPKVSSFIEEVAVEDNQAVHAGDLLIRLDDRDFQAALAKTEAGIGEQQAGLEGLIASRKLQEALVAQEEAAIAAADAEIDLTRNQEGRTRKLLEGAAESRQNFEKAEAGYKSATAEGLKARASLEAARRQLDVLDSRSVQLKASLQKAVAERDLARLDLSHTELRAPVDGIVGNRSAQVGAFAPAGSQLISLVPAQGLWIDANFKENQIAKMKAGMPVEIEADSHSGRVFQGHVASLAPATGARFSVLPPENATGNFTRIVQRVPVRIALDEGGSDFGDLRPGLSVIARVNVRESSPAKP
jgi:membrane fusion protein (multidrug efflux system)